MVLLLRIFLFNIVMFNSYVIWSQSWEDPNGNAPLEGPILRTSQLSTDMNSEGVLEAVEDDQLAGGKIQVDAKVD